MEVAAPAVHVFIGKIRLLPVVNEPHISCTVITFDEDDARMGQSMQRERLAEERDAALCFEQNRSPGGKRGRYIADPIEGEPSLGWTAWANGWSVPRHHLFRGKTDPISLVDGNVGVLTLNDLSDRCLSRAGRTGKDYKRGKQSAGPKKSKSAAVPCLSLDGPTG